MSKFRRPANARGPLPSLVYRIPPECRAAIERAILNREFRTIRDVWLHSSIAGQGVSKSAFYRYAKCLRHYARLLEMARSARTTGLDPLDSMTSLIDAEFMNTFATGFETSDADAGCPVARRTNLCRSHPLPAPVSAVKLLDSQQVTP